MMEDCYSSEDEIFFGKLKLKEVKKRLGVLKRQPCIMKDSTECDSILQARSEPNLNLKGNGETRPYPKFPLAKSECHIYSSPKHRDSDIQLNRRSEVTDESFLIMEYLTNIGTPETTNVRSLSLESLPSCETSPNDTKPIEDKSTKPFADVPDDLDNTLDRVDFILKAVEEKNTKNIKQEVQSNSVEKYENKIHQYKTSDTTPSFKTPHKPMQSLIKTPRTFKTPLKSTNLNYQNIVSPIAYCIKNSASAPLVQNVRPSKPIASSSLPKRIPEMKLKEKGNMILPRKAYRSAKETKLIENSPFSGLPKNKQVKNMIQELAQPKIVKHEKRVKSENSLHSKNGNIEDSFANLTVAHADVSVCTIKPAMHTETLVSKKY